MPLGMVGGTMKIEPGGPTFPNGDTGELDPLNAQYCDQTLLSPAIPNSVTPPGSPPGWVGAVTMCETLQKVYWKGTPGPAVPASYVNFVQAGGKLAVSIKPPQSTTSGDDAQLTTFLTNMIKTPANGGVGVANFKLILWQEFQHDFPSAAAYLAYCQHYVPIVRAVSPQIIIAYDAQGFDQGTAVGWYPGDQYMDEIGCDYYSTAYMDYTSGKPKAGQTLDNLAAIADGHANGPVPLNLFEIGYWAGNQPAAFNTATFEQYCSYLVSFFGTRAQQGKQNGWLIWFFSDPNKTFGNGSPPTPASEPNTVPPTFDSATGAPNDPKIPGIQNVWQNLASQATTGGHRPPLLEAGSAAFTTGSKASATLAFTIPSGTLVGDIISVWCAMGVASITWTAPGGPVWTAQPASSGTSGSCQLFQYAYKGTEGWTPGTTQVTFTASASHPWAGIIFSVDGTNDPALSGSGQVNPASTVLSVSGVVTQFVTDTMIWLAFDQAGSGTTPAVITPPSGFTTQVAQASSSAAAASNVGVTMATIVNPVAGATGAENGTMASSSVSGGLLLGFTDLEAPVPADAAGAADLLTVQASSPTAIALADKGAAVDAAPLSPVIFELAAAVDDLSTTGIQVTLNLNDVGGAPDALNSSNIIDSDFAAALDDVPGPVITVAVTLTDRAAGADQGGKSVPVGASGGADYPQAYPGTSQVAVAAPGSATWYYIGSYGQVTALTYSFACPGGCDKLTCTLMVPASYRNQILNPGWQVRVTRGGHQVWDGKLDEAVPTASGWNITATGTGNLGQDYDAVYTDTWPNGEPDESINGAINRGLPWTNPGVGSPAGIWLGQGVDSAAQTITALLNLACSRGGLTWYVNSQPGGLLGDDLSVFPLPTVPNRLLVATTPIPRTLGGDINRIWLRYEVTAASTSSGGSGQATYALTSVTNPASITQHQSMETYIDVSDIGPDPGGTQAQAMGNKVLSIYQRASFAGPFTARYGDLLTMGGQPIDPGTDQAGTVVKLLLTDFGYGGEVVPSQPVIFITGAYAWDDFAQVATITPYQNLDQSLTGLLQMENTMLVPIKAGG